MPISSTTCSTRCASSAVGHRVHWKHSRRMSFVAAAVQHWLLVLGEAASRLSSSVRESHPDVPWRVIIDNRNFMAHGYRDVDLTIIWNLVDRDLPNLDARLAAILQEV